MVGASSVRRLRFTIHIAAVLVLAALRMQGAQPPITDRYLDEYFRMFPTRATEAGRHDFDDALEDLSPKRLAEWVEFNRQSRAQIEESLGKSDLSLDERLDFEALFAQIDRELHLQTVLRRPECDPLYWTSIVGNATIFLLLRDDLPLVQRQERARVRSRLLPAFAKAAQENFALVRPEDVSGELCELAGEQLRAAAGFYRDGFTKAAGEPADATADALTALADELSVLGKKATGSPRLGKNYGQTFQLGTGLKEDPAEVLSRALADLSAKKKEAAEFGRSVWAELLPNETKPEDESVLLRRLFQRVAAERDNDVEEYFARWQANVRAIEKFVREKKIITLPDPLTLIVDRSPPFFLGQ
ncbi:MAG: DUF885 family protein, partial [Verrucomicrobiota bacterium]|nr:DUF885 family protein [Verrucomicrobiota bacterium]